MNKEKTTIEELVRKGWISKYTERILSEENVNTVGDIGYGNPYDLKWLSLPHITPVVSDEILEAFARMDEESAKENSEYRSLFFDQLPSDLQYHLTLNFDVLQTSYIEVEDYVDELELTVEKMHNAAISGIYGLMRLGKNYDLTQNTHVREFILTYLDDEIYTMGGDIYAKVREIYAKRRTALKSFGPVLHWEEIRAFHWTGKLKHDMEEMYADYLSDTPILQRCQLSLDTLVGLFYKPKAAFVHQVSESLQEEELEDLMMKMYGVQGDGVIIIDKLIEEEMNKPVDDYWLPRKLRRKMCAASENAGGKCV